MIWTIVFLLGLLGAYFVVEELVSQRKTIKKSREKTSQVKIGASFLTKTVSIGALTGLIGYGIGMGFSRLLGKDWSFVGIVSLQIGFGIWVGACGLVIGFSLAFRQYHHSTKQNDE